MIDSNDLYWLLKLDDIRELLGLLTTLAALAFIVSLFSAIFYNLYLDDNDRPLSGKVFLWPTSALITAVLLCTAGTFLPTTKQMVLIRGIPALLSNQKEAVAQIGKTPVKIVELLNKYLDKELRGK